MADDNAKNRRARADIIERLEVLRGRVRHLERNEVMAELDEIIKLMEEHYGKRNDKEL